MAQNGPPGATLTADSTHLLAWAAALLAAAAALVWLLGDVIGPFAAGLFIAAVLDAPVSALARRGVPRGLAVLLVLALAITAAALLLAVSLPRIATQIHLLATRLPVYVDNLRERIEPLVDRFLASQGDTLDSLLGRAEARLRDVETWKALAPRLLSPAKEFVARATSGLLGMMLAALQLLLTPVVAVYLLLDFPDVRSAARGWIPAPIREDVLRMAAEVGAVLRQWLRGQLTVAALLGVMYWLGLALLGTPLAFPLGVVAGLANMVPYLGLVVGVVPALLLSLLEHGSLARAAGVIVVFSVAQFLEGNVLTPRLVGSRIGLHPVIVMLAVMAGGTLFGFTGVLLAVPAAATAGVVARGLRVRLAGPAPGPSNPPPRRPRLDRRLLP